MGEITRLNLSWTLLFFGLFLGLFWGRSELLPTAAGGADMPLGSLLNRFSATYPIAAKTLAAVLLFLNSILLLRIVSRNMILTDRSYMPIIVYLLVAAGCGFGSSALGAITVSLLAVCSFDQMLGSFRRAVQYGKLFNAALLAGLAPLVWSHAVVYAFLLPVSLILFKKGGREWIVAWVGFLLPWAICSYVYWGMGYPFGPRNRPARREPREPACRRRFPRRPAPSGTAGLLGNVPDDRRAFADLVYPALGHDPHTGL